MRMAGFTLIEVFVVLIVVSTLYAFLVSNLQSRRQAASFAASTMQARVWSDAAEIARQRGVLDVNLNAMLDADTVAPTKTPFGNPYRITATKHTAWVSFDLPFKVRGGGVFTASEDDEGGTLHMTPSIFPPTAAMQEKMFLYQSTLR